MLTIQHTDPEGHASLNEVFGTSHLQAFGEHEDHTDHADQHLSRLEWGFGYFSFLWEWGIQENWQQQMGDKNH